jgi:predicted lipid-binding transport protein (Tim44 family)
MRFVIAVYIHVDDSGLPIWQVVPLTILGCAIAYGLISAVIALAGLPGERRLRRRVRAVQAAAGRPPPYGVAPVEAAAERLFKEVQSAWDAGDRERLSRVSDPDLMADWITRLDGYAADGKRQRVRVLDGPRLDYVSLLADRGLVRLRVRAKLRRGFEPVKAKSRQRAGRKRPVGAKVAFEEFWTLSRSGSDWILYSTRPRRFRSQYTSEPIVSEAPAGAAPPVATAAPPAPPAQ